LGFVADVDEDEAGLLLVLDRRNLGALLDRDAHHGAYRRHMSLEEVLGKLGVAGAPRTDAFASSYFKAGFGPGRSAGEKTRRELVWGIGCLQVFKHALEVFAASFRKV